jgi:DNA-binding HxlR family transcriptional regulator
MADDFGASRECMAIRAALRGNRLRDLLNYLDAQPRRDNSSHMPASRRGARAKRRSKTVGWQQILELLAAEWSIRVVQALDRGPKLYPEMRREFRSASQTALAQTLRNLQDAGLVWRKAYPTSPARVEYSLTSLGKSFIAPLGALCEWADQHERELTAVATRGVKQVRITARKRKELELEN